MKPPKPRRAPAASRPRNAPVLLVPDCEDSDDLQRFVGSLEKALARRPSRLVLRFVGVCRMASDPALVIHHLLALRQPSVHVHADALSPIAGPGVVLWLAADTRALRPDAWIWFRGPRPRPGRDPSTRLLRDPESWKAAEDEEGDDDDIFGRFRMRERVSAFDQPAILRIIDRYLPARELADRRIPASVLRDFGLLDDGRMDRMLAAAFAKEPRATLPPEPDLKGPGRPDAPPAGAPDRPPPPPRPEA